MTNFELIKLRKGLDTVESLSAGAARDPNRNIGTVIIIYIFVIFTHSNIDFHQLLRVGVSKSFSDIFLKL